MLSDQPAIVVDNVSKYYMLSNLSRRDLKTALLDLPSLLLSRRGRHSFWALRDCSVTVQPCECVGLIGPNGSGKSTLLRLIAQISQPSTGRVTTRGRVAAMLELGAGFHPQLTGRENAILNAVLMGLSRREAEEALPDIIDFAEIGDFVDQPMRTYSSGMYLRLGFAVAVHVQPEILLVDEVLAVGDAEFQSKCFDQMERLRQQGVTLLMASHDIPAIQRFANRVILLEHGQIVSQGEPKLVMHEYLSRVFGEPKAASSAGGR